MPSKKVPRGRKPRPLTENQRIVKRYYAKATKEKLLELTGLSWDRVKRIASDLKIKREETPASAWNAAKRKILVKNFPSEPMRKLKKLTGMSEEAIRDEAERLELKKEVYWTEEREALLRKVWPTEPDKRKVMAQFEGKKGWEFLRRKASDLGLNRPDANKPLDPEAAAKKAAEDEAKRVAAFRTKFTKETLARARTQKEICFKHRDVPQEQISNLLGELKTNPPEGYVMRQGEKRGEETFYLARELPKYVDEIPLQESVFTRQKSDNDDAYIAVKFPENLNFTTDPELNALTIIPIDSVWWSDPLNDEEKFLNCLRQLEARPYEFAFLNGNIIGGRNYDKHTAEEHRLDLLRHLKPVAHKILFAQSGDLEGRAAQADSIEPLQEICRELKIPHTIRPVRADIHWKHRRAPRQIYAIHGRSGAKDAGGMKNAVEQAARAQDFPEFTVMGHLQQADIELITVREQDPISLRIYERHAYAILAPGFMHHEGSRAEIMGQRARDVGIVKLIIKADNRFEATY